MYCFTESQLGTKHNTEFNALCLARPSSFCSALTPNSTPITLPPNRSQSLTLLSLSLIPHLSDTLSFSLPCSLFIKKYTIAFSQSLRGPTLVYCFIDSQQVRLYRWRSPGERPAAPESSLTVQTLQPHHRTAELGSALKQDPQVIPLHLQV